MEKQIIEGIEQLKEETLIDCVMINYKESPATVLDSKAAGTPYFPVGFSYPVNEEGYPLFFLAQINFEQFPKTDLFPDKGLLQFYIDGQDDLFGVDITDEKQKNFRVVYHEDVDLNKQQELPYFDNFDGYDYIELFEERKMNFEPTKQFISLEDHRFYPLFESNTKMSVHQADELVEDLYEKHLTCFSRYQNQSLGYPTFLQADLRPEQGQSLDVLLFQAVASEELQFAWGECGILNFFMNKEDLKNKDFSNVYFQFDVC